MCYILLHHCHLALPHPDWVNPGCCISTSSKTSQHDLLFLPSSPSPNFASAEGRPPLFVVAVALALLVLASSSSPVVVELLLLLWETKAGAGVDQHSHNTHSHTHTPFFAFLTFSSNFNIVPFNNENELLIKLVFYFTNKHATTLYFDGGSRWPSNTYLLLLLLLMISSRIIIIR
jgi:hypothetical protein